jgi:predicted unusual protein kinase regulating ubiquinone biosynthesis (AarF/ABC1/UbiB family)
MARIYKTTYEEVYKLHAEFGRVPPSNRDDRYWQALNEAIDEYIKDRDDQFSAALLLAVYSELTREAREADSGEKQ